MVVAVTMYQSTDGVIHPTEAQAKAHERMGEYAKWYDSQATMYFSDYQKEADWEVDVLPWLKDHRAKILEILVCQSCKSLKS